MQFYVGSICNLPYVSKHSLKSLYFHEHIMFDFTISLSQKEKVIVSCRLYCQTYSYSYIIRIEHSKYRPMLVQ